MSDHNGAAKRPKPYLRQEADDDDSAGMKPKPYLHQPAPADAED
jgi:hypothetical protein